MLISSATLCSLSSTPFHTCFGIKPKPLVFEMLCLLDARRDMAGYVLPFPSLSLSPTINLRLPSLLPSSGTAKINSLARSLAQRIASPPPIAHACSTQRASRLSFTGTRTRLGFPSLDSLPFDTFKVFPHSNGLWSKIGSWDFEVKFFKFED